MTKSFTLKFSHRRFVSKSLNWRCICVSVRVQPSGAGRRRAERDDAARPRRLNDFTILTLCAYTHTEKYYKCVCRLYARGRGERARTPIHRWKCLETERTRQRVRCIIRWDDDEREREKLEESRVARSARLGVGTQPNTVDRGDTTVQSQAAYCVGRSAAKILYDSFILFFFFR